ncbi:hypothetical protein Thermus77420_24280 [Thermus thalpophilus]
MRERLWLLGFGLALLLAACGGQGGGGNGGGGGSNGGTAGTVNTPGGPVQVSLQGGTFTQGPSHDQVNASGYQTPYGGIAFTARLPQAGGTLTVTLTFPQDIPQGAVLLKCLNGACNPIPGAQLQGRTATFRVQDGSPLDADGQANGQVRDPVALGVAQGGSGQPFALYPTTLQVSQGGVAEIQVTLQPGSFLRDRVILVPVVPDPNRQDGGDVAFGFSLYPASFVLGTSPIQGRLTLSVGPDVPPGTYTLRVFASSGLTGTYQDIQVQVTQGSPSRPSLTLEASYPFKGPSELGFQGVALCTRQNLHRA